MDWLLGCFTCGQRRQDRCSIARLESKKDKGGSSVVAAGLFSADSTEKAASILHDGNFQLAESFELGTMLTMPRSGLARTSSGCIKTERRRRSASGHSSDQLSLVEKLESEINNLNEKLVEEASQAKILTNEVRHLRQCTELLDSTDAFRRALDALENASEKGDMEESQPLLYLQSMLSKIETTEVIKEALSVHATNEGMSKGPEEELFSPSSSIEEEHNYVGKSSDRAMPAPDQTKRSSNAEEGSILKEEHTASIPVCQPSFEVVNMDANKPQLVSVTKRRRSSKTFSFSGFIVIENDSNDPTISENYSGEEVSVTKIIETPDTSSENLVEASKSLFAFATTSSRSHSISTEQTVPQVVSEDFLISADSEVESCVRKTNADGSLCKVHESTSHSNTQKSYGLCPDAIIDQSQVEISDESYEGFSDVSSHKFEPLNGRTGLRSLCYEEVSTFNDSEVLQLQTALTEDKGSAKKWANSCASVSQLEDINDAVSRSLHFADRSAETQAESISKSKGPTADFSVMHVDSSNDIAALISDSESKHLFLENGRIKALEKSNTFLVQEKLPSSHTAASNEATHSEGNKYTNRVTAYMGSLTTCSSILQDEFSIVLPDSPMEFTLGEDFSVSSPSSDTSQHPFHTLSPSPQVGQDGDIYYAEIPSTPISVNPRASRVPLFKDDSNKPHYTPLKTPLTSFSNAETPNSLHSKGSPTISGEDRPILGTVAAHWNHSSSSTKKWWDGKGIPNSTNKYKEDQKVSWHATPFEVRLERALAKQGRMFQKKLFIGATEMEVSS